MAVALNLLLLEAYWNGNPLYRAGPPTRTTQLHLPITN